MAERFNSFSSGSENEGTVSESHAAPAAIGEYIAPGVSHDAPAPVVGSFCNAVSYVPSATVDSLSGLAVSSHQLFLSPVPVVE